jgi:hypothetical protein
MPDFFQIARSALYALILAAFAFIILWNFRDLDNAVRNLPSQAAALNAVEVLGSKLTFSVTTVEQDLKKALEDIEKHEPDFYAKLGFEDRSDYESHILALIQGLNQKEIARLMDAGELKNLCKFEHPTPGMRVDLTIDYRLKDKGLTAISDSSETLDRVRDQFRALQADGKLPEIGHPLACYDMTLTPTGYNTKTVLVKTMSRRFRPAPEPK